MIRGKRRRTRSPRLVVQRRKMVQAAAEGQEHSECVGPAFLEPRQRKRMQERAAVTKTRAMRTGMDRMGLLR